MLTKILSSRCIQGTFVGHAYGVVVVLLGTSQGIKIFRFHIKKALYALDNMFPSFCVFLAKFTKITGVYFGTRNYIP